MRKVTIWTKDFPPDTTSDVAGGLLEPYIAEPRDLVLKWTKETMERFYKQKDDPEMNGHIMMRKSYEYHRSKTGGTILERTVRCPFRRLKADELKDPFVDGWSTDSIVVQTGFYLSYLVKRFQSNGGVMVRKQVDNLEQLLESKFEVIINCTGVEGYTWLGDQLTHPIRGQVVCIKPNGWETVYLDDEKEDGIILYVIPRKTDVIIGGTADKDNWNRNEDVDITKKILNRAKKLDKRFENVEILQVKVGLRPGREKIRLEAEHHRNQAGQEKLLIHNYGHGGSGWTVCYGCAEQVVQLLKQEHRSHKNPKTIKNAAKSFL